MSYTYFKYDDVISEQKSLTVAELRVLKRSIVELGLEPFADADVFSTPATIGEWSDYIHLEGVDFFGIMHPSTAPKFAWIGGYYLQALKLWLQVWMTGDANQILNSIPWEW